MGVDVAALRCLRKYIVATFQPFGYNCRCYISHQMYLHIILLNCITVAPEIFHLPSMAYDAWLTGDGLSCLSQFRKTLKRKRGWKRVVPTALSLCRSVISSRTYGFFLIVHTNTLLQQNICKWQNGKSIVTGNVARRLGRKARRVQVIFGLSRWGFHGIR